MSWNDIQWRCPDQAYLRFRGAFEQTNYGSFGSYVPEQQGSLEASQWQKDNPSLTIDHWRFEPHDAELSAEWLEQDIIRRLGSTTTPQCDLPIDHPVPELLRPKDLFEVYSYPSEGGPGLETGANPFSLQDNELARRQHRMKLAFNCFRQCFWPTCLRARVFDSEEQTEDEELGHAMEPVRQTDLYKFFAKDEYDHFDPWPTPSDGLETRPPGFIYAHYRYR